MFTGLEICEVLKELGVTHVIWLPSSGLGPWENALESCDELQLLRVCREGEAWPLAAGLYLGGKSPIVVIQTTGLFESGDAMRNVLFDLKLPLFAMIGARSWLAEGSRDTAKHFAEPILRAWGLDYIIIANRGEKSRFIEHYEHCRRENKSGAALIAEGRM